MSKFLYLAQIKHFLFVSPSLKVRERKWLKVFYSSKLWTAMIFILLAGSLIVYIHQINSVSTAGLRLRKLEQRLEELKEQNRQLEVEIIEKRSLLNLYQEASKLGLVSQSNTEYLEAGERAVVFEKK